IQPETVTLAGDMVVKPDNNLPFGSAPNAIAVSPNDRFLYVALGGNNCIAVVSLGANGVIGLIPTGWYPGDVQLDPESNMLYVANTKGVGSRNEEFESIAKRIGDYQATTIPPGEYYNSHTHRGSVSIIPVPEPGSEEMKAL